MMTMIVSGTAVAGVVALMGTIATGACDDDPTEPSPLDPNPAPRPSFGTAALVNGPVVSVP
jgi:hypothetical protein